MLRALRDKRLRALLLTTVRSGDLSRWPKLAARLDQTLISTALEAAQTPAELCISYQQPKVLRALLREFPALAQQRTLSGESLLLRALQSEDPLPLVAELLTAGADPNQHHQGQPIALIALSKPPQLAMLLISRLVQHGAELNHPALLSNAVEAGDAALVKFLVESGAAFDKASLPANADPQLLALAERCLADKQLRELW